MFKKKELSDWQIQVLKRLGFLKEYIRQAQSDLNYSLISEKEYRDRIYPILKEIENLEKAVDSKKWKDRLMGLLFEEDEDERKIADTEQTEKV